MRLKSKQPKRAYFSSIYNDIVLDEIRRNVRGKVVTNKPPMMNGRKSSDIPYNGPLLVPINGGGTTGGGTTGGGTTGGGTTGGGTTGGGTTGGGTTGGGSNNFTGQLGPAVPFTNTYIPIQKKIICPILETIPYLKDLNGPIIQIINEERLKRNYNLLYTNDYLILAGYKHLQYIFANPDTLSTHTIYLNHPYHDLTQIFGNPKYVGDTTIDRINDELNDDDVLNQGLVHEFVIRVDQKSGDPIPDFSQHLNVISQYNPEFWNYITENSNINRIGVSSHFKYVSSLDLDVYLVNILVYITNETDIKKPQMILTNEQYPPLGDCSYIYTGDMNPDLPVLDIPYNSLKQGLKEPLCFFTNKYNSLYTQFNPYLLDKINELRSENQLPILKFDNRIVNAIIEYGLLLDTNSYFFNNINADEKYNTLINGSINNIRDDISMIEIVPNSRYESDNSIDQFISFNKIAEKYFFVTFNGSYVNILIEPITKENADIGETYGLANDSLKTISEFSIVNELNDGFYNNFYEKLIHDPTIKSVGFAYSTFKHNNIQYVVHHYAYSRNIFIDVASDISPETCVTLGPNNIKFTDVRDMDFNVYCDQKNTINEDVHESAFNTCLDYINELRAAIGNKPIAWSDTAWQITNNYIKGFKKLGEPDYMLIKPEVNDHMFLQRGVPFYDSNFTLPSNNNWFIDTSINNPITLEKVIYYVNPVSPFINAEIVNMRSRAGNDSVLSTYEDDLPIEPMKFLLLLYQLINFDIFYFHKLIGDPFINSIGYSYSLIPNYYYADNNPDEPVSGGSGGTGGIGDGINESLRCQNIIVNSICFGYTELDDTSFGNSQSICYPTPPPYTSSTIFPRSCIDLIPRSHSHVQGVFAQSLELINNARSQRDLSPLTWSVDLAYLADLTNKYVRSVGSVYPGYKQFELVSSVPRTSNRTISPEYVEDVENIQLPPYLPNTTVRASFYNIIFEETLPSYDVEFPIYYRNQGVGFNPNQYVMDIISGRASGDTNIIYSPVMREIGINYMYDQTVGEPDHVMFNLVVSPTIVSTPIERSFFNECRDSGSAPPQDGTYANPLTKSCPLYNHLDWPILCPTAYSYDLMQAVSTPVIAEMNGYRTYRGMQPLIWNKNLTWAAQIVATYWYNNPPISATPHETPLSPHGTTLLERLASANWVGTIAAEGISGDVNYEYPTNPKTPNIMNAFCAWKSSYAGNDIDDSGHFNPFVRSGDSGVQSFNSIGIGWILNFDSNNDAFLRMVVVYANTTTDTQNQAPALEDEIITCVPDPPNVDPSFANPLTRPCPLYSHPEYPVICPTPYTFERMESITASVIAEMNGYRIIRGMQPLVWNKNLTWAAQIQASYRRDNPGSGHNSPLSPYGPGYLERVAASNFIGNNISEGLWSFATNGGEPNIMQAFCVIREGYTDDITTTGHFEPMVRTDRVEVQNFNAVGIGWTRRIDQPNPGWINCDICVVYGTMTSDNSVNTPALEDPLILCIVSN